MFPIMPLYFAVLTWFGYKWESEIMLYSITQGFYYVNSCFYSCVVLKDFGPH